MNTELSYYVAGHAGMVGSAIVRALKAAGCNNVQTASHYEIDLTTQNDVDGVIAYHKPDVVIMAAARVGGIMANSENPAAFAMENLQMATNVIDAAFQNGVERLVFLGSSCVYPKNAECPIKESALLTGPLEKTNEAYALAKIMGIKMCEFYRRQHGCNFSSVMPCNLYGPGDNYDPNNSHVLPALIRKFHEAKSAGLSEVTFWGTGRVFREFLHVDDVATAVLAEVESRTGDSIINIGSGAEWMLQHVAEMVADVVGYTGNVSWDHEQPCGTYRKVMDDSLIRAMGWRPTITLRQGVESTYQDFKDNYEQYTKR